MLIMHSNAIEHFFKTLQVRNPHPVTELRYTTDEQLLIAVILSAQSTDVAVNRVTEVLFALAPKPSDIVELGEERLTQLIRTLGLYRSKAKHVLATCNILDASYQGKIPRSRAELEALPGVGRKTANVVLNTALGEACIAVDTHVFRVANRTGLAPGPNVAAVERHLMQRIPAHFLVHAHHWLILHGRYTCKAQKPLCETCPVRTDCLWENK